MNSTPPFRSSLGQGRGLEDFGDSHDAGGSGRGLDLRGILQTLWRGKWLVLLVLCLGVGLAVYNLSQIVPLYTAEAQVRFITDQKSIADLQSVVSGVSSEDEALYTETMVLRSRRLLGSAVDELGLASNPEFLGDAEDDSATIMQRARRWARRGLALLDFRSEPEFGAAQDGTAEPAWRKAARLAASDPERDLAIEVLSGSVDVGVVPYSYVLSIAVETRNPEMSAAIANTLAELYVESQLEAKFDATRRATVWLSEQVADLKTSLEDAEAAVEEFAASAPLVSEDALKQSAQRIESLRVRRRERLVRLEDVTEQLEDMRTLRQVEDFAGVAARLEDAQLARLAEGVAAAGSADARSRLAADFDAALSDRIDALETQAAAAERQAATLAEAIADGDERLEARSDELIQLRQLQREAEATRLLYQHFLSRMKETSVQEGVQQADAEVFAWASPPKSPSYPHPTSTVARATMLSLVLGGILVYLLEHLNRRFRTPEELEQTTGAPVMAAVPTAPGASPLNYIIERPNSAVAEAIRNLRTSVLLSNLDRQPQVIMVTSSLPAEGKSTVLLMLAQTMAKMGKRTLVIEGDIRRPRFRAYLGQPRAGRLLSVLKRQGDKVGGRQGLLSVLSGHASVEEAVYHDENSGLDVLFSQRSKVNATDLFTSNRFAEFIGEMRERYDYILIDTPPVLAVPDARVLAQSADAVLYAVRWRSTTREQVQSGLKMLAQAQVRVTGLALTRADTRALSRYGYEGYGAGYGGGRYYAN